MFGLRQVTAPSPPQFPSCTECQPTLTYKSLNGSYYESASECAKHNKFWKEQEKKHQIRKVFKDVLDHTYNSWHEKNKSMYGYGNYGPPPRYYLEDKFYDQWRAIRDQLNRIQE